MKMKVYNPGAPISLVILGQEVKIGNREIVFLDMNIGSYLQQTMVNLECQQVEKYEEEEKAILKEKKRKEIEAKETAKANAEYTARSRGENLKEDKEDEEKEKKEDKEEKIGKSGNKKTKLIN